MAVETAQVDVLERQRKTKDLFCLPGLNREAEVGVDFTGVHFLERMCIYSGCKPEQQLLPDPMLCSGGVHREQFLGAVYHEMTDAVINRERDILIGLVV